jgi:hypothetical protein
MSVKRGRDDINTNKVIVLVPLPFNEKQPDCIGVGYEDGKSTWKFVVLQEGQGKYAGYPKYSFDKGYHTVVTTVDSSSYLEATVTVPKRGTVFAYNLEQHGSVLRFQQIQLIDSKSVMHTITPFPVENPNHCTSADRIAKYDISPYAGQTVRIRFNQCAEPRGSRWWYYGGPRIINKPYTLHDNFGIFMHTLESALIISLLIGFVASISGLEIFNKAANKTQTLIHENKASGMGFENKYIKGFLSMTLSILDTPMHAADKVNNTRLRTGLKITSLLFLSFTIIYVTYIVAYIVVMMVLALVILAIIIWIIISLLGSSPSGGSIGGGGGSSGSSNSSSKDGYYEKDGKKYDIKTEERIIKQDGRTYRDGFFGWNADKDFFGDDEVERDFFGDPKIEKDFFGDQKIEKDFFGDPIVPPKKKK